MVRLLLSWSNVEPTTVQLTVGHMENGKRGQSGTSKLSKTLTIHPLRPPWRTQTPHFFIVTSKALYSSAKVSKASIVFLANIVGPGIYFSVLFKCCAETSLSVVEKGAEVHHLCSYHISICRVRKCGVRSLWDASGNFHNITRTVAAFTLVKTFKNFDLNLHVSFVASGRVAGASPRPH